MSYPGRPCGGPFTTSSKSIILPSSSAGSSAEEDIDALLEQYAQEFEEMEKQGDMPGEPKGATWERADEIARANAMSSDVNIQYDPEGKNRSVRFPPQDRFRLLDFIQAQRKKAEYEREQREIARLQKAQKAKDLKRKRK